MEEVRYQSKWMWDKTRQYKVASMYKILSISGKRKKYQEAI